MEIKQVKEDKKAYLPLLLDADPDEGMLDRYLEQGEMFVAWQDGVAVCEAVVVELDDTACELKNIATHPDYRLRGFAGQMLPFLFAHYGKRYDAMFVGTSEQGRAFYEAFGFRYSHIIENFFIENYPEEIIDDGEQCIDMVYFKRVIGGKQSDEA